MVRAIRAKLPLLANLLAIIFGMVSILVFTWFFDYIEELYIKIPTTALAMSLPIPVLFAKVRPIYEMDKAKNALFGCHFQHHYF